MSSLEYFVSQISSDQEQVWNRKRHEKKFNWVFITPRFYNVYTMWQRLSDHNQETDGLWTRVIRAEDDQWS